MSASSPLHFRRVEGVAIATPTTPATPSGIFLTLESTGVFLGILVSASVLATVAIQLISKFNNIANSIKDVREDLATHVAAEGHERLIERVSRIEQLDKKLDLHIQDYVNRKDTTSMLLGQLNEKIDHKFSRLHSEIKDVQRWLEKQTVFGIRSDSSDE